MLKQTDTFTQIIDGVEVTFTYPLYLWMYPKPNNRLTIDVCFADKVKTDSARLESKVLFHEATEQDVFKLLAKTKFVHCLKCGEMTFDSKVMDTNRNGWCEACYMTALNEQAEANHRKEAQKAEARDKKMFSKGYRYKLVVWIHPTDGREDYGIESYSKKELSEIQIRRTIKKEGSAILDDYTQTKLEG